MKNRNEFLSSWFFIDSFISIDCFLSVSEEGVEGREEGRKEGRKEERTAVSADDCLVHATWLVPMDSHLHARSCLNRGDH